MALQLPFPSRSMEGIANEKAIADAVSRLEGRLSSAEDSFQQEMVKHTAEGGLAIRMLNGTGTTSVKGSLVAVSTSADSRFVLQANMYDTFGVVYESGIPNGSPCWVVISGIADVLLENGKSSTRGNIAIAAATDGRAETISNPGSGIPAVDTHFKEIGHVMESKTSGTNVLARCILHFN